MYILLTVIKFRYGPVYLEILLSLTLPIKCNCLEMVERTLKKPIQSNLSVLHTYKRWWQYIYLDNFLYSYMNRDSIHHPPSKWCLDLMPSLPSLYPDLILSTDNGEPNQLIFWRAVVIRCNLNSCVGSSDQATILNIVNVFLISSCAMMKSWLF